MIKNALFISDTQIPFEHVDALAFCDAVRRRFDIKPTAVYHVGDLVDNSFITTFVRHHLSLPDHREIDLCIEHLRDWQQVFPRMRLCVGNHELRAHKRLAESGLSPRRLKSFNELYGLGRGWEFKDEWVINGDTFVYHGDKPTVQNLIRFASNNSMNVICGHHHTKLKLEFHTNKLGKTVWAMNTGCLIDKESHAFYYGKKWPQKPTLGLGLLVNGQPHAIQMPVNGKGRWTGELPF